MTIIIIVWKKYFRDRYSYYNCHNHVVIDKGDMILLQFDQKTLFGKLYHREIYLMKEQISTIIIRDRIKEIKQNA